MKKTILLMSLALVLGSSCCSRCPYSRAARTSSCPCSAHAAKASSCPAARPAAAAPATLEDRLAEIEKRLEYLTSELALQRGDLDRVREKAGIPTEGAGQ